MNGNNSYQPAPNTAGFFCSNTALMAALQHAQHKAVKT